MWHTKKTFLILGYVFRFLITQVGCSSSVDSNYIWYNTANHIPKAHIETWANYNKHPTAPRHNSRQLLCNFVSKLGFYFDCFSATALRPRWTNGISLTRSTQLECVSVWSEVASQDIARTTLSLFTFFWGGGTKY